MDIKTLLNNLHEEVSCSVCMNTFTDPKTLPCLHSFCLHCLPGNSQASGHRSSGHHVIKCPKCRRESRLPSGNLTDLPTNSRIDRLLEVWAIKECETTGVKCGNCDKKSNNCFYCFQCSSFWCGADCISLHNGIKVNKQHLVLALKDFQDKDFEKFLKRPTFCREPGHEKKELEFFCKNCEDSICSSCFATSASHDGHAKVPLDEAANERTMQVMSAIKSRKQIILKKRSEICKLEENCAKIHDKAKNVKRSAEEFVDNLFAVIEEKKQKFFNEVDSQTKASFQRLGITKEEIEDQVKMTETAVEETEKLLTQSTKARIMQPNSFLNKIIQEKMNQDDPTDGGNEVLFELHFVKNKKLLDIVSAENIGSLQEPFLQTETKTHLPCTSGKEISEATVRLEGQIVLTTRNAEGEQLCSADHDHVTSQIRNFEDDAYKTNCGATVKIEEHVHGCPYAGQFRHVFTFGREGSSDGDLWFPWGLAVNKRDQIAVTDVHNERVQLFSSDGTHLKSFGGKGYKQGQFIYPAGIDFDNNGNVTVVDSHVNQVKIFNENGNFIHQFGGKEILNRPLGLSVDSDGNIIVADSENKLIKIFSPRGQFIRKIGGKGSFAAPFHCVQYNKYLIVSDHDKHCIKVFNKEGVLRYKIGKKGKGDGEFNKPHCLSVDKAGHLMVCDAGNHRLQLFELSERSGKFLTKFGTKGKGKGEFDKPVSTAFLSDGRVVVSDFENHRIQIFEYR